jgi:hypothetical protein
MKVSALEEAFSAACFDDHSYPPKGNGPSQGGAIVSPNVLSVQMGSSAYGNGDVDSSFKLLDELFTQFLDPVGQVLGVVCGAVSIDHGSGLASHHRGMTREAVMLPDPLAALHLLRCLSRLGFSAH